MKLHIWMYALFSVLVLSPLLQGCKDDITTPSQNICPTADAGPAIYAEKDELVFFDGTLSYDGNAIDDLEVGGGVMSWEWDFGDGTPTASEMSPSHSYASSGEYTITLTVADEEGLSSQDTAIATIYEATDSQGPLISHTETADGQPLEAPVTITAEITDPSDVGSAVLWYRSTGSSAFSFINMTNGGSGDTYSADIPGASVTSSGVEYYIECEDGVEPTPNKTLSPEGAPDTSVYDFTVDGNYAPVAEAGHDVYQDEGPDEEVFFDGTLSSDADGIIISWYWDFGDGSSSNEQSPRHSYASAGFYTITLTVTDNEGLTGQDTAKATVYGTTDTVGPWIYHNEIADGQDLEQSVTISAEIQDPSDVYSAALYYRPKGSTSSLFVIMTNGGSGDTYSADIPGASVTTSGVEYWIICIDGVQPDGNTSTSPVYDFTVFDTSPVAEAGR